jgi:hypothetical protein
MNPVPVAASKITSACAEVAAKAAAAAAIIAILFILFLNFICERFLVFLLIRLLKTHFI